MTASLDEEELVPDAPSPRSPRRDPAVSRRRLVDDVADDLTRTVRSGRTRAGERLPTVAAMAASYGVAAHTVREALARVAALGLIEIRHGAGIFVAERADRLVFANPSDDPAGLARSLELLETRAFLEPPLAAAAARHASDASLNAIEARVREAEPYLDGSEPSNERLNRINLTFHTDVARASGNDVAADVVEALARLYSAEQLAIIPICERRIDAYPQFDHDSHLAIVAALRDRDPELAEARMREHVRHVLALVEGHAAELADAPADDRVKGGDRTAQR